MIIRLDTDTTALSFEQLTQLEGVEYLFRFLWADRESSWYLGLYDTDENPIAVGIRLVVNFSLLRRFVTTPGLPPGFLFCLDTSGQGTEIQTPGDLGTRCPLYYVTSDDTDLAAALA